MTAPSTTAAGVTNPYTLTPGAAPVRITDGANNSPAGLTLVNRGDNGQTVWIMGGPSAQGAAVPLGPGASLQWSDPVNLPYAYVTGAGTARETLVVSSQSSGYTNPTVVAVATAAQLAAQGIPNVMTETGLGTYRLNPGASTAGIPVGAYASLVVSVYWPQPTPQGACAVRLTFDDPAVPDLQPAQLWLTANNFIFQGLWVWQIPVSAARLTVTALQPNDNNNAQAYVSIVGTNRAIPAVRQLGQQAPAIRQLKADTPTAGTVVNFTSRHPPAISQTTANGSCGVYVDASVAGTLSACWIAEDTTVLSVNWTIGVGFSSVTFAHPTVPVWWIYNPTTSVAGARVYVTVAPN